MTGAVLDRVVFELHGLQQQSVHAWHERMSRWAHAGLAPTIETAVSAVPDDVHVIIPAIELDLGRVGTEDLEHTIEKALRVILEERLRDPPTPGSSTSSDDAVRRLPASRCTSVLIARFLCTGTLPWWAPPEWRLHDVLDEQLSNDGAAFVASLAELARHQRALKRLAGHVTEAQCRRILGLVDRSLVDWFERCIALPGAEACVVFEALLQIVTQTPGPPAPEDVQGAALLERVIARLRRESGGSAPSLPASRARQWLAAWRAAGTNGPASVGEGEFRAFDGRLRARTNGVVADHGEGTPLDPAGGSDHGTAGRAAPAADGIAGTDAGRAAGLLPVARRSLSGETVRRHRRPSGAPSAPLQSADRSASLPKSDGRAEGGGAALRSPDEPVRRNGEPADPGDHWEQEHVDLYEESAFEGPDRLAVSQAGLVLLWPYLPAFFAALGLRTDGEFTDDAREKGVRLLHQAATATAGAEEHELVLPKLLCGWPLERPLTVNGWSTPTAAEAGEIDTLLTTIIEHWVALGNTSLEGLRSAFLQRPGLVEPGEPPTLRVERRGWDVLLDRLPYAISIVKLSWMDTMLRVEW